MRDMEGQGERKKERKERERSRNRKMMRRRGTQGNGRRGILTCLS